MSLLNLAGIYDSREYWMFDRWPGLLTVVYDLAPPSHPLPSVSPIGDTQEDCERELTRWRVWEGGGGVDGGGGAKSYNGEKAWSFISHSLLFVLNAFWLHTKKFNSAAVQ